MFDFQLPAGLDVFDWFILALRIAFIALIYLFLYQVGRASVRELVGIGKVAGNAPSQVEQAPVRNQGVLEVMDPGESSWQPGTEIPLDYVSSLGRLPVNGIVLDDTFVSGTHAEITYEQQAWWLTDLGSTNGTRVNNRPVAGRVRLNSGDTISIGRVQLRAHL